MDLNRFNPRQREAITHVGSPLLVLAGAGSGKTSVITHKIAWLIQQAGNTGSPYHCCHFTNKASREMRERVGNIGPKIRLAVSRSQHSIPLG